MINERLRTALIDALKNLSPEKRSKLEELKKATEQLKRKDVVWHMLLCSMATMGNSRGYKGLIENSDNYREVAYENLLNQKNVERYKMILETLKKAKIRMAAQKAKWLYENFVMIESMGGAEKAREMALNEHGMEKKIAFMMHFKGIGPKYARNVWMDFYHPDFYQNIAIDERIKKISKILNVELENYTEHENFYLEIAKESGLQGWELDRILYSYNDEFVASLQNEE